MASQVAYVPRIYVEMENVNFQHFQQKLILDCETYFECHHNDNNNR